jgi:hypothetical protein
MPSRVGHTGARTTLADASYHKVHSTRFGAGHRVGIQNAPAGGPLTDHRSPILGYYNPGVKAHRSVLRSHTAPVRCTTWRSLCVRLRPLLL